MAENMNSGGGMTIDDFKEILKELGIGQSGKNAKTKIQIDTTQATENVTELEEAFQKLWSSITNNKTKAKYFQSLENATVDLKKTWNDLVSQIEKDKKNGTFNLDKLYTTAGGSKQTGLLRMANAFEALGGNLKEISPQIYDFVEKMREAMKVANPNYQFTVEGFSEAFEKFEELRKIGATIGNINFGVGFTSLKQDVLELADLTLEMATNVRTASESATEEYEKQADAAEEATKKIEKLSRAEMERKLKTDHEKNYVSEYDIYFDYSLDDIQRYSSALDELQRDLDIALDRITRYNNKLAEGETGSDLGLNYNEILEQSVKDYHKYLDQVEYVQEKLRESIRSYSPAAEGGDYAKELNALILILRDLHGEIIKISSAVSTIDGKNGLASLSESFREVGDINGLFNSQQFQELIELFKKMELSLNSIKEVLVDVGDGEEFSPLFKTINNIRNSILKLNKSISSIGLNLNIDYGSDKELETKYQEKIANALQAYQRLFDHIKSSSAGNSIIIQKFFDFDIDQFDTMVGKLQAYKKFIDNMREEAKRYYNGHDVLYEETEAKYWKSASSYMGQLTKVINQTAAAKDASPLNDLFGKTDLTEVTSQLSLIVSKLEEIADVASEFKTIFSEGFNISSSIEDIEKFNNRVKELEDELTKLKTPNIVLQGNQTEVLSGVDTTAQFQEAENKAEEAIIAVDNFGKKIDETFAKKLSGTALVDGLGQIVKLFHATQELKGFDKFDKEKFKSGKYGKGAYLGTNSDINTGWNQWAKNITTWYANVRRIFDVDKDVFNEEEISKIVNTYLQGSSEEYINQVKEQLSTPSRVYNGIRDVSKVFKGLSFEEIWQDLGIDALNSGEYGSPDQEMVIFDPERIFPSNWKAPLSEIEKINEEITSTKMMIEMFGDASDEESQQMIQNLKEELRLLEEKKALLSSQGNQTPLSSPVEQVVDSASRLDKILEEAFNIPFEDFDSVIKKFNIIEEKAQNIAKITKSRKRDADGKYDESYNIKYKDGSSEIYGESSSPHLLSGNNVLFNETAAQKEAKRIIEENIRLNKSYYDSKTAEEQTYQKLRAKYSAEGKKQEQEYYKDLDKLSKVSYQKELSLEQEKNTLLIKNLGATSDIIKANETRISQINKEIELEQKKRLDSGLSNAQRQKALDEERLQLTKKLANAQETHNARLIEAQKLFDKNAVEKISKGLDRILVNKKQFQYNDAYKQELEVLQAAINEFNQKASLDIVSQEDIDELDIFRKKIEGLFEKFSSHTKNFNFQLADPKDIYKQMEEIQRILHDNTAMPSSLKDLFRALEQDYKLIIDNHSIEGTVANVEGLNIKLAELKYRLQESGKTGNSVFTLIGKKIKGLSSNFIAMYLSLYDIVRYIRQGVTIIKEYDDALTEMRKVTDESVKSLKEYQKTTFDVANAVGTTATALQKSTADFLRIGESLEQAAASAQTATVLFNVSEFESIDEATDSLISMSAAFKELDKGEIVDVVNQLGNNFAISTDGLARALQNSASALKTAQNDFFEAAALTTAANDVTQDPDKVGAGLRTIALRLTGTEAAREELAEMGEDVDDFIVTTTSKMDQKIKDLTKTQDKMGVSLLDMNGNYRSTYEVLLDIAKVWDTIAKEDLVTGENRQNALLEMMAGKNRANILASILQSPDVLEEAYASALSADGSAQKELDKYLDSITGKVAKFQNQLQELATTTIDSEVVKNLIDFGTKLLSLLTDLIDKAGVLGTLGGIGGIILGVKNVGKRRSTMFHFCFEYADRDRCLLY